MSSLSVFPYYSCKPKDVDASIAYDFQIRCAEQAAGEAFTAARRARLAAAYARYYQSEDDVEMDTKPLFDSLAYTTPRDLIHDLSYKMSANFTLPSAAVAPDVDSPRVARIKKTNLSELRQSPIFGQHIWKCDNIGIGSNSRSQSPLSPSQEDPFTDFFEYKGLPEFPALSLTSKEIPLPKPTSRDIRRMNRESKLSRKRKYM